MLEVKNDYRSKLINNENIIDGVVLRAICIV